ncbi:hypothetical protein GDO78_008017 [Eleutherodactylus coqui]|uniref:Uncharacterized protein n=1 Tax=Eleutherodactylus coqui TaxID=57060 RepID=A0A8J6FC55_ELECQ|nr:hypothetical protein GDO78_008017 [Eleutherodactylus coqui]
MRWILSSLCRWDFYNPICNEFCCSKSATFLPRVKIPYDSPRHCSGLPPQTYPCPGPTADIIPCISFYGGLHNAL